MARRFKRRPRVVWLYPTGTPQDGIANGFESPGLIVFQTSVTVGSGAQPTFEIPLVVDNDPERTFAGAPLSVLQDAGLNQAIQYGYRIRRIVGHIHLSCQYTNDQQTQLLGLAATAGLIVRRVESDTGTAIAPGIDVHPALIQNFPDPWIWRRTWVLNAQPIDTGPLGSPAIIAGDFTFFPRTTGGYGDVRSGPHVDAKTARIVGPEERLFLDIGVLGLPIAPSGGPGVQEDVRVTGVIDLRVLASIRTNQGNRRNASR